MDGACHACGHDVHTAILLGTGLFLARAAAGGLPGKVRLIFQPAEEVPGGALDVLGAGGIASVDRIFALHCDPRLDVGKIGTGRARSPRRATSSTVQVTGPGGHTARPHLTADLVYALGKIITELPAALSRRVDPAVQPEPGLGPGERWLRGQCHPRRRRRRGHGAVPGRQAWHAAPGLVKALLESVASAYGVVPEISYERNVRRP